MTNTTAPQRQESDRHQKKTWLTNLFSRPEVGPIGVMLLLFGMLGYFSIPAGEMSWNPFSGEGFNALYKKLFKSSFSIRYYCYRCRNANHCWRV